MRASLSDPDSPSTLNFRGGTVSSILAERGGRTRSQSPHGRPAFVAARGLTPAAMDAGPRRRRSLMHEPALPLTEAIHRPSGHPLAVPKAQHRPTAADIRGRMSRSNTKI